jgi:hypothetical protein
LNLHKKAAIGPILTFAAPIKRKENYCIKFRQTLAYNFADLEWLGLWGRGIRFQTEVACCIPFKFK